jgi:hypothetical protein
VVSATIAPLAIRHRGSVTYIDVHRAEVVVASAVVLSAKCWRRCSKHMAINDISDDRLRWVVEAGAVVDVDGWVSPAARCEAIRNVAGAHVVTFDQLMQLQSQSVAYSAPALRPWAQLVHWAAERRRQANKLRELAEQLEVSSGNCRAS